MTDPNIQIQKPEVEEIYDVTDSTPIEDAWDNIHGDMVFF
jgi:hypothetical protein